MINKVTLIRFDSQAGAWTDETNWVKGSIINIINTINILLIMQVF